MTFRSFSRFVRWYRLELALALVGSAALFSGTGAVVFAGVLSLFWAVMFAVPGSPTGKWRKRVLARHRGILRERAVAEKIRLRLAPLRGWTK